MLSAKVDRAALFDSEPIAIHAPISADGCAGSEASAPSRRLPVALKLADEFLMSLDPQALVENVLSPDRERVSG